MKTEYRIMAITLCLLLVGGMVVPVSATSISESTDKTFNFLNALEYDYYLNGAYKSTADKPSQWVTSATAVTYTWTPFINTRPNTMVILISSSTQPTSVTVSDPAGNSYTASYVGSSTYYGNIKLFQYSITGGNTFSNGLSVNISYTTAYTGNCAVVSMIGHQYQYVLDSQYAVQYYRRLVVNVSTYFDLLASSTYSSYPGSYTHSAIYGEDDLFYFRARVTVPKARHPVAYAESVTFLISSYGTSDTFLAHLIGGDGNPIPLETSITESMNGSVIAGSFEWDLHWYLVTVDVSGYNLDNYQLVLQNEITPIYTGNETTAYQGFQHSVYSILYSPENEEFPWWYEFTLTIKGFFADLKDFFVDLFNPDSSGVDDFNSTVESQAPVINDAVDKMDEMEIPQLNPSDLTVGIAGNSEYSAYVDILAVSWNQPTLLTMVTIAVSLMIASYILFGDKR